MAHCRLCKKTVADYDPYCRFCGHARIGESLKASIREPRWLDSVLLAGLLLIGLGFLATVGVAFLREAQALRWGRQALEADDPERAYELIAPHMLHSPDDLEGLFLSGRSAIATNRADEAWTRYQALLERSDRSAARVRVEALAAIYRRALLAEAETLTCEGGAFAAYFERYEGWVEEFEESLLDGAAAAAGRCASSGDLASAREPGAFLIHVQQFDAERVVERLYLEPAREELAEERFRQVKRLATLAVDLLPSANDEVDQMLEGSRSLFTATFESLRTLCSQLAQNEELRRCFPPTAPGPVARFADPWGRPIAYAPSSPGSECSRGFELTSWAPEGAAESTPRTRPSIEVDGPPQNPTIRLGFSGRRDCRVVGVERFWLREEPS